MQDIIDRVKQRVAEEAFTPSDKRSTSAQFDPDGRGKGKLEAEVAISIVRDVLEEEGFEPLAEPIHIGDDEALYGKPGIEPGLMGVIKVQWDFKQDVFDLQNGIQEDGMQPCHDEKYIEGPSFG